MGFYNYKETAIKELTKIHPIDCQMVCQSYWTHRSVRLIETENQHMPLPPGYVIYNNLLDKETGPKKGIAVSDGSVHLQEHVAAAAWVVALGIEYHTNVYCLVASVNRGSSY